MSFSVEDSLLLTFVHRLPKSCWGQLTRPTIPRMRRDLGADRSPKLPRLRMAGTVKLHIRLTLPLRPLSPEGIRHHLLTTASLAMASQPTVNPRTGSHRLISTASRSTGNRGMGRKAMDSSTDSSNMGSSMGSSHILMVAIASRLKLKGPELLMHHRPRTAIPLNNLHTDRVLPRVPTDSVADSGRGGST